MGDQFDLFADLEKKVAAQDAVLGINPPRTQPEPPPSPAPEPVAVAAEVVAEEAPKAKRGRRPKVEQPAAPLPACSENGIMGFTTVEPSFEGGFEFEVVWGREARSPESGEGYEVGPFSAKGRTHPGESLVDAMYRVHAQLGVLAAMARADRKAAFEKGSE